ncbi:DUF6519 domain-containing protein [Isoptericola sp. b515]|uniref:DUF6519 domain-containing protein n=1 Tax=Isoptericola sp. b515 TaxID=3064652 RepID=UPI0027138826|nr:DUF6519 domain-containing protein [Isoptericola sp. b515]MDO8149686.1 DUF6519 domain-containing protein [Isoptericola sp. b515]
MHADLTRWTFDPAKGYRSVLLQQGRVLLDAEWNEQASIAAHHDETRTADVVGADGGPAPHDGGPGPFAVVDDSTGLAPSGTAWGDLAVTGGRYYVDGVLVESAATVPLGDQPYLEPGEPGTGRWAVRLDVLDRLVTPDERPELLESALGGPDTALRTQTVWQVRLDAAAPGQVCSDVAGAGARTPRKLRVRLQQAAATDDPCSITSGGGFTRLENQLYRVEVHDVVGGTARWVWSRENGSVVAGLDKLEDSPLNGTLAQLTVDRTGRDDELSIGQDDWVEVTSPQRQVRGLPGWMAQVTDQFDTELHVDWLDGSHPASLAEVGGTPLVRRWEGPPTDVKTTYAALEAGIEVSFPAGGEPAVGDYWLVPARTSRLAYGVVATHGTVEWPWSGAGSVALPPLGPVRHSAALAVLDRTSAGWTLVGDCRHLFPALTEMVSIDLVGGDGQEALPGSELAQPVRLVVRNGGLPVVGAPVHVSAPDGGMLRDPDEPTPATTPLTVRTDADGVAEVWWTLLAGTGAPTTQTLVAHREDDHGAAVGVDVVVTGRLSVAKEVAWTPPCPAFGATGTVQEALDQLATTPSLRLLGGDGQEVAEPGATVPRAVRVAVDSPCGPVVGARVTATASQGALVLVVPGDGAVPGKLSGAAGAAASATATTDKAGVAAFAWQPSFSSAAPGSPASDVLSLALPDSDEATVRVTAQLDPPGSRVGGVHVQEVTFFTGTELVNDHTYGFADIGTQTSGIAVGLDAPVQQASVQGKPVARLLLDLPWPAGPETEMFGAPAWARRTVEIAGETNADGPLIVWWSVRPLSAVLADVLQRLRELKEAGQLAEPVVPLLLRFQLDGWAVLGEDDGTHLNGHTDTVLDDKGRTRLVLPSTDAVTGGRFETWFWFSDEGTQAVGPSSGRLDLTRFGTETGRLLTRLSERRGVTRLPLDDLPGRTLGFVERRAVDAGVTLDVVEEDAPDVRRNTVLGTELLSDDVLRVRVSRGAARPVGDG